MPPCCDLGTVAFRASSPPRSYPLWESPSLCFLVGIAAVVDVKGWFAKWREFLRSETELGMDNLDYVPAMTQMLDELEAIVGRT